MSLTISPADRFSICLPFTLAQECPEPENWSSPRNFSNDAHDPGGETMCGITQREYDIDRKRDGLPCRDVRQITQEEGEEIYQQSYWFPHCPDLPPGLDLQFFDASVNEGCTEAVRILQHVFEIEVDGVWGPQTALEASDAGGSAALARHLIEGFTKRRQQVYRASKGFPYFGKDWERRASEIGATALKMVTT